MVEGRIHSVETFGTVDGPGIRYVVFLQGCPLRCKYCHNPDTQNVDGGKVKTAQSVIEDALRYRAFLKGGGITATGGEPLYQPEFVAELFALSHENGIHTALDTSGACFQEKDTAKIDEVLKYTDLVLLDLKQMDDQKHRDLTGASNTSVLAFAKYLEKKGIPVWIRVVAVPNLTDDDAHAESLGSFLATLSNVKALDVLPYHTMGVQKYRTLGIPYPLEGVPSATEEQARVFRDKILSARKKAKTQGKTQANCL